MSIHKLTAGSGYDYLTRQVAALDATAKGHVGLAAYYTARGESPGTWVGAGIDGLDGLHAGDQVTAEQMKALFGLGLHPLALQDPPRQAGTSAQHLAPLGVLRLGAPFRVYDSASSFNQEVARRHAVAAADRGAEHGAPLDIRLGAEVRTEVGREFFLAAYGREPRDARELAGEIARVSRASGTAVAGYDLTFSPVKSVSALWAVADQATAAAIERAHELAVADALRFVERHALFTREGTNGVRQVEVRGLVAAAFTHRDSRAGDPDLHTHVAVANKVQTLEGRWLAVDGRVLFKATVAASESYNTALEGHLRAGLGLQFAERPGGDPRLRPVREIVGVDPRLNERWSARRQVIEVRRADLADAFQSSHGRPPTPVEALQLAQQATLETRPAKHEPRSLHEQRSTWRAEAIDVLDGHQALGAMVHRALAAATPKAQVLEVAWFDRTTETVLSVVQGQRSTWQMWHVRAEAYRQVRATSIGVGRTEELVDRLVTEVRRRSVALTAPDGGPPEPSSLRRRDGTSVYRVVGADLYTSAPVLAAEQRLLQTAERVDGRTVDQTMVELALLQSAAGGLPLNEGQAGLVRAMAESGARLQLALAPAGAGKTTALRALASAWTEDGGAVVGLAPSAAAAAQLRDQIRAPTDTLAKLDWSLGQSEQPHWVRAIGPSTLVIVDEAGMADTLTLDAVVAYVVGAGGSVRLVGDDQQLAAIGAGGVLRDIAAGPGAVRLTELLRFRDPAEGAASLALREGRPEALGFYLDQQRINVGDLATATDQLFTAWQADQEAGLDALMLAPTRNLVASLNHRARAHRLNGQPAETDHVVTLADGNKASPGDFVITRANDRRLRTSPTDWVRNGDRWTISAVHDNGDITACRATGSRSDSRRLRLPAAYVQTAVELGYATTVHTAQGVTADTMHGLAAGQESRQQLYTMLTRGRHANHLYVAVVGDGDPHSATTPQMVQPLTPTELLEQILVRDDAPRSATTQQRDLQHPATRLGDAAARYVDALHHSAEKVVGPAAATALEAAAEQLVPGLTDEPAWPTLRSHLLLLAADGADPAAALDRAATGRELDSSDDRAAVLDWRVQTGQAPSATSPPLPWLPAIPTSLADHPDWGPYLTARAQLVTHLATDVITATYADPTERPAWLDEQFESPSPGLVANVAVWRAATQVAATDRRPTGPRQQQRTARMWQHDLDRELGRQNDPAVHEQLQLLEQASPRVHNDPFATTLASRLAVMTRAGARTDEELRTALSYGPLPDNHPAGALWWRITRGTGDQQPFQALAADTAPARPAPQLIPTPSGSGRQDNDEPNRWVEPDLAVAAMVRDLAAPLEPSAADLARMAERADAWHDSPVTHDRLVEINQAAHRFYQEQYRGSWTQEYLTERFGCDISDDRRFQPGHAPAGWSRLIDHLRHLDITDEEMLTAGLALRARTGRLVDRFRDRAMLPITSGDEILGFVGRQRPDLSGDGAGPKYLNTPTTPLFHKGDQLYGANLVGPSEAVGSPPTRGDYSGLVPVLVEGPMDAIAVTLAGRGRYVGVAPLGTALSGAHAQWLASRGLDPVIATDADGPGDAAATRAFWLLTPHRLDPRQALLPGGADPATFLHDNGVEALNRALDQATPLGDSLMHRCLADRSDSIQTRATATHILAARPSRHWDAGSDLIHARLDGTRAEIRAALLVGVNEWNSDPRRAAQRAVTAAGSVATLRLDHAQHAAPGPRPVDLPDGARPHETSEAVRANRPASPSSAIRP